MENPCESPSPPRSLVLPGCLCPVDSGWDAAGAGKCVEVVSTAGKALGHVQVLSLALVSLSYQIP